MAIGTVDIPIRRQIQIESNTTGPIIRCLTIWAAALFILVNLACSLIDRCLDQQKGPYISCASLTKAFKATKPKPNIVLLGSSLMRMPFFLSDRQHTDYITDYDHYCLGQTLQNILKKAGLKNSSVFNFSIDGEMVSDVFLINKKLLSGTNKPEWIIYGIAPRDFTDSLLSQETKTPIFDCLFTVFDVWDKGNAFITRFDEKLDISAQKLCFLYGKRKELQIMLADALANEISTTTFPHENELAKEYQTESQAVDQTLEPWQEPDAWKRSMEEYRKRYKNINQVQFQKQLFFLKRLCEQVEKNSSKLLLVNMPLTEDNIGLMASSTYSNYQKVITTAAKWNGVHVLDLQNSNEFPKALYRDNAHLNDKGAHRLGIILSDTLQALDNNRGTDSTARNTANTNNIGIKSAVLTSVDDNRAIDSKIIYPKNLVKRTIDGIASWWLAKSYFAQVKVPDIVVLGSSQLGALYGADTYVFNKVIDLTGDHRSRVLEHDFYGFLDKKWKVFLGALPEATISDQFIISRTLFSDKAKPKLVVLTFSPEDFIDSHCAHPENSEAFAFFSKYMNCPNSSLLRNEVKRNCADYDASQKYVSNSSHTSSSLLLGKPFERLCPGEITIASGDGYRKQDSTDEYRLRYKNPFSPQLKLQMQYLDDLLSYLKKQNIKAIAFGLPLSSQYQKLLPENFWTYYNQQISQICKKNDADWIDIDRDVKAFKDNEFMDGAHLTLRGGLRLSSTIALYTANKFHLKTFFQLEQLERKVF